MTTTNPKVSILDLPIAAIRDIEKATGAKMTEWPNGCDSIADLYARIYSAGEGVPMEEVEKLTLRELTDRVVLGSGDDEDESDPT